MEFSLANTTYSLKGDESLRMKRISLHHMQALLEVDDVYGVYEVYSFSMVPATLPPHPRLSEASILGLPNFEDMFIVEAGALDVGTGSVLIQNGKPMSYFSQKLGPRMRVAATYQKELFAIVEAVYKWRQYLLGCSFTIRIDHRSLKELMQQVIQTPLQQKYVRKLMGFDFAIEYKISATNLVADALSRMYDEADDVIAAFMALSQPLVSLVDVNLRKENENLDELKVIHQKLKHKEVLDGFRREQGMVLFRDSYFIGVESKLKELLLSEFHNTSMARHIGVKKMLMGMSALFYWKGMRKSIEDFIRKVLVCQQIKYSTQAPTSLLQPLLTPSEVWEDVSMDFIMGLPVCKDLSVILVVVDRFTKYAHFGTLPASCRILKNLAAALAVLKPESLKVDKARSE
ncbi:ty3-gypsy retrotransposon protein [Tanacetum coccineum]